MTPRTEAGKRLAAWARQDIIPGDVAEETVLAIESEAATAERKRVLDDLETVIMKELDIRGALPEVRKAHKEAGTDGAWDIGFHMGWEDMTGEILAAIEAARELQPSASRGEV